MAPLGSGVIGKHRAGAELRSELWGEEGGEEYRRRDAELTYENGRFWNDLKPEVSEPQRSFGNLGCLQNKDL